MKKLFTLAIIFALSLTFIFGGCNRGDDEKTITIGASAVPHAEILEVVKPILEQKGYTLKIKIFDDYVLPNTAVDQGEITANFFQHVPYLNSFNRDNGTKIKAIATVHYEAFGIYSNSIKSVDGVTENTTVAIPNDGSNRARALLLLQQVGLISLKDGGNATSTVQDIIDEQSIIKSKNVFDIEAKYLTQALSDKDVAVINGNYALTGQVDTSKAFAIEEASVAATEYANVLCVKEGNENLDKVVALKEALLSDAVKDFIQIKYKGFVVAVF